MGTKVQVSEGRLNVQEWSIDDGDVVRFFEAREDKGEALGQVVKTGVVALNAAGTSINLDHIERRFDEMQRNLVNVLNDQDPHSPMHTLRDGIGDEMKDEVQRLKSDLLPVLLEIAQQIAAAKATKDAMMKSALKGLAYEQEMFDVLGRIAKAHGDVAEFTGGTAGIAGLSKRGDVVVTINPRDTGGVPIRVVFEAKDKAVGLKPMEAELTEALDNRLAAAAVGVYAKGELMPGSTSPFHELKERVYLTVLDKDEPQNSEALGFVYSLARHVALKSQNGHGPVDAEAVHAQIAEARKLLVAFTNMKTSLTNIRKTTVNGTEAIERELDELRSSLQKALQRIDECVGDVEAA